MIGAKEFEKMEDRVVFYNTARGVLIGKNVLVEALSSTKVYSVGLDVFEDEPDTNPALLKNDKVILLPHIVAKTIETLVARGSCGLDNGTDQL
jgi:glyoxylate reductase